MHDMPTILRNLFFACIALLAPGLGPAFAAQADPLVGVHPGYEGYVIGDPALPTPGPVTPGLMLVGGGDWPTEAFAWFFARSGHGHVLVLRASGEDQAQVEMYATIGGLASVRTLVFHDRAPASDPALVAAVAAADGIFLAGGDQSNYVRFWKGTPLSAAIDAHVAAGKPIGGTSAGLAILGRHAYGAMDGGSLESAVALRDPFGPEVTLVNNFLSLPFLQDVITDSHFSARERLGRLVVFVANLRQSGFPATIGIGVDEATALCIEADGSGRIHTLADGKAWLVQPQQLGTQVEPGRPLRIEDVRVTGIDRNSSIDMATLMVQHPAFVKRVDARDGRLVVQDMPAAPVAPASGG